MNELIEKLLQPISAEHPCGPDLSNDPRFDELQTILNGKPEVEMGNIKRPAEPPDWSELKNKSTEFLGQSKHLRVAVMFCCSLLKSSGLPGFRDGVQLIQTLLDWYWLMLYPRLDPEDSNDPTQRLNILSALAPPPESKGLGWLTIIEYLYATSICQLKGAPPITFEHLLAAKKGPGQKETEGKAVASDLSKLEATIRSAGGDQCVANHESLQQAIESVKAIDQFLTTTLGADKTISFDVLQKTLEELLSVLKPYLPSAAGSETASAPDGQAQNLSAGFTVSGSIRSRQDVARAIDAICEYYRQVEPGSPVPYLLRRAQRIATMNFVQAVQELSLGTADTLKPSMGSGLENITV